MTDKWEQFAKATSAFSLPGDSRVWIFQSSRFLTESEIRELEAEGQHFTSQWKAHGAQLSAEIKVISDLFLVVALDENVARATGCSIDKVMHFVQELEFRYCVSFTNRLIVAWIDESGGICLTHAYEFGQLIREGKVNRDTRVFNNLVVNLEEMREMWSARAGSTWLSRYFNDVSVN